MSTRLYFRNTIPDWSRGEGDANLQGATVNWQPIALSTVRGDGVNVATATSIAGPVTGIEPSSGGSYFEWVSEPLDRDVTISGSVLFNLWAEESSMNANAGIGMVVERLNSQGAVVSTIWGPQASAGELGTNPAVRSISNTPTSTNMLKGDRLRVRVYFDDAGGTMAAGHTLSFDFDGATAADDGDSYVEFTEDFGFQSNAPGTSLTAPHTAGATTLGNAAGATRRAQSFVPGSTLLATSVDVTLQITGSPTDNVEVAVQTDSSGAPSGTDLTSASIAASSLTGSLASYNLNFADVTLTAGQRYWLVFRRSGAIDGSNYFSVGSAAALTNAPTTTYDGSAWGALDYSVARAFTLNATQESSQIFLTDASADVDPNGASFDAKEAWTSRGSGVVQVDTSGVLGPTAPLLARVSAAGNFLEWFTPTLEAFTLAGLVACNVRAREAGPANNGCLRVEIAVCDGDGANPVVWGAANDGAELNSSVETAVVFFVAGDDTSVSAGSRLRLRVYFDDAPGAAMAVSTEALDLFYAGTSAAASGDTYVTFGQTLVEQAAAGFAFPFDRREPRAHLPMREFDPWSVSGWKGGA